VSFSLLGFTVWWQFMHVAAGGTAALAPRSTTLWQ
jgi:hypothetical protein